MSATSAPQTLGHRVGTGPKHSGVQSMGVQRVGVYGGAFDPPHKGHVALAATAVAQLQLDVLHIVPTGQAWHKAWELTPAMHRLAMAQLAFADVPHALVDPREIQRTGASYTVDTLRELQAQYPGAQLYLILGQDQSTSLTSWHRWEAIPQLAIICVAERAGFTSNTVHSDAQVAQLAPSPAFLSLDMSPVPLNSTDIRHAVAKHQIIAPLVFEPVARYIDHHHLYQTS